jgi:EAL domain-containing protein (putative c-di-GMP-specific phosphodiesterase class I)
LIIPISLWVLQEACRQHRLWRQRGFAPLKVAVNVSAIQFARSNLAEKVSEVLAQYEMEPRYLELELTEGVVMRDIQDSARQIADLRALGVSISIDDFGTGYSSLSQLQKLDVDVLKIDRSFTAELCRTTPGEVLVRTIIEMSKALGMVVVAEGVETPEQFQKLRALGCDEMQGFLISRPVEPDRVESLFPGFVLDSHEPS